jgi:hypothetical protein
MPGPRLPQAPRKTDARFDDWSQALAKRMGLYYPVLYGCGSHTAGVVAGTYFLPTGSALGVSGTGTAYPPAIIYLAVSDYVARNGPGPKLRIRATLHANDVAPTGNFTFGLYPVTRPGSSGGAGVDIYTLGTVVAQATQISTPAADSSNTVTSAEFSFPADGYYVLGLLTSGTVAVNSHLHATAMLQVRNI